MGHRQIRIHSDGDPKNTVVTLEDGRQLYPTDATIFMDSRDPHRVDLTFILDDVDVHADLDETDLVCPICQHKSSHHCPRIGS